MADYTEILDDEILPDSPGTSILFFRLRDNPEAIAEGAPGAPKNLGKSMDIDIGNMTGTTAIVDLDDAAKVMLVVRAEVISGSPTANAGYQLSADNGSTWGSAVIVATGYPGSTGAGTLTATAAGAVIIDMTGYNAIRLSNVNCTGALIWVEGA